MSAEGVPAYSMFAKYLERQGQTGSVACSFGDIEEIIHGSLPPSAKKYKAWWSNSPSHPLMRQVLGSGWIQAGLSLKEQRAVFKKRGDRTGGSHKHAGLHAGHAVPNTQWAEFEADARLAMEEELGVRLPSGRLDVGGKLKNFDLVNEPQRIVGDVKNYKTTSGGNRPSAKFSVLNEYVWLMERLERFDGCKWRKLLVVGEDARMAKNYVNEFGALLGDVEVYLFVRGRGPERIR